jgi:hypothetical protein
MVIGVIGVNRSLPDLRPGTVSTIGRSAPSLNPSRDIPMTIQLTGFAAGRSHHGGLMCSLLDMSTLPLRPSMPEPLNAVPNPSRRFRGCGWHGIAISDTATSRTSSVTLPA